MMQFKFETLYNQETLSVMAKCLRKTVRKKKSKRSHAFGWIVAVLAVILSFIAGEEGVVIDFRRIITWLAAIAIVGTLIFEDQMNGYFARKRLLNGTEKAIAIFDTEKPEVFISETAIGKSEFSYDKIVLIAETERYFVFVFSENHAQVYDKSSIAGGTVNEFKDFMSKVTNTPQVSI